MSLVYLNGNYVEQAEACIPVTDRGLLFGDSIYEVIPVYGGKPFGAEQHLQRLQRSLDAVRIPNPLDQSEWLAILERLSQQQPGRDQSIYLQVTRGEYPQRAHRLPEQIKPNVIAFATAIKPVDPSIAEYGLRVITIADMRWQRCDIKSTNLLANVLALAEANEQGADDAILIRDGIAKEGTASNLFIVLEGLLITPPNSETLLLGVTRNLVLELAAKHNLPYAQASISLNELNQADEIWLTSSTREIVPITQLNDKPVGSGKPGPIWQQMNQLYQVAKQTLREQLHDREST